MPSYYSIKRFSDASLRADPTYVNSFECYSENKLLYTLHYHAKFQFCEPCVIQDHRLSLSTHITPIKNIGGQLIQFLSNNVLMLHKKGNELFDGNEKLIARIQDPTPKGKSILRTVLGGQADTFHFVNSDKTKTYVDLMEVKIHKTMPWPFSIIESFVKLLRPSPTPYAFEYIVHEDFIDPAIIFGVAVLVIEGRQTNV